MKKTLHTIKNSGFKTPEDYFATLEDTILSHSKLKEISSGSEYKIPENYFDSIEDKIINAVQQKEETKVIKLFTWRRITYASSIAASIILMISIFFNNTKNITLDNIETASIENYILNEDLETNEFSYLFSKEDLSNIRLINDGYNSQNLENYVFDNLEIDDIITK